MSTVFRVVKSYESPYSDPMTIPKGTRLRYERRESEWAGWIWCTDDAGTSRWVPERSVKFDGAFCVLKRDYNAVELSVDVDEILSVEFTESGWGWATRESGQSGWVPLENLQQE